MAALRTGSKTRAPILVVDDDPALRGLIQATLRQLGYDAIEASSAAEARRCLGTRAVSLVLCDYEMPGGTGLELLSHISEVHADIPFILLTGHDDTPLARSAITAGALDFLAKPFELRQLARLLEQNWARMERDRKRTAELTNDVLAGTIRALVAAVDAKDPYTASHSERVTLLALQLGQALGLPAERLRILEFSALLHDVGKIAVPTAILSKPGPLTTEEWSIVREHPARSAEIVRQVGQLSEVATIVRHHHERVDGHGYPDRLAGDAIPSLSRVIAIADAYEALTSDRAYRPAVTPSQARAIIRRDFDGHFDRGLGELFVSIEDLA